MSGSSTALLASETPTDHSAPGLHEVAALNTQFAGKRPEDLLAWSLERFGSRLVLCTAFQAEGMVLLDMAWRIDPLVRVATIDTGRLPQETHDLIDLVRFRYGLAVEVHSPDARQVAQLVRTEGPNLFRRSVAARHACCDVRKVAPLRRLLAGVDAWVTGLRRAQAPSRARTDLVEVDPAHGGILKLSPLAAWQSNDVAAYVERHEVPINALYEHGYTSIGCAPCTRPVEAGEDPRAGRWWWERGSDKECGIHRRGPNEGRRPLDVLPVVVS